MVKLPPLKDNEFEAASLNDEKLALVETSVYKEF